MNHNLFIFKSLIYQLIPKIRKKSVDSTFSDSSFSGAEESLDNATIDSKAKEILLTNEGKEIFFDVIESVRYYSLLDLQSLHKLGELFIIILNSLEAQFIIKYFYKIVTYSHIFSALDVKKIYLFEIISNHDIFKDQKYWIATINEAVTSKVIKENELFHKNKRRLLSLGSKNTENNKKFQVQLSEQNSAIYILGQFIYFMTNICGNIDIANAVVTDYLRRSKFEQETIFKMMVELHSLQNNNDKSSEIRFKSLYNRSQERAK